MPTRHEADIRPLSPEYRDIDIQQGFDWSEVIDKKARRDGKLLTCAQYLVVFRSVRAEGVDPQRVADLDHAAYEEASKSPALLHYFAGEVDDRGSALSWCLWTDRLAAFQAVHGNSHQNAVGQARELYGDNFSIELYSINPENDGSVAFLQHSHPKTKSLQEVDHA